MKKIIFIFLFFCLAITTVLAQVATINIATPNSNGLSNNQVNSFDVNSDGTILNNSATGGTAQLGNTGLAANNNITGSEADLILFQVTGTSGSGLNGAIEVFGGEAGLIIANPNGIDCDGCGFINTSKVDLVTGTANFSGDDLTGFSIDGSSTLTVSGSGFLSDAVADELKLEAQNIIINAQVKANNSLEIIANNYTQSGAIDIAGDLSIQVTSEASLDDNASIQSSNLFFSAYDLYNQADFTITDNATFDIGNGFNNGFYFNQGFFHGGDIIANNFNVTATHFSNRDNATISADNFNVTVGDFINRAGATINADNFNVTTDNFYNYDNATINADNFNVTVGTYGYFYNRDGATISADNFNVTAEDDFINRATINADNFNVTAGGYFYNDDYATISADNFNVTADDFYNRDSATISADSLNISYNSFDNEGIITDGITYYFGNIFIENVNNLSIIPDGTTLTDAIQSSSGIDIINIARPDSNGLSNNSYSDFNVLSSGLVFNNSSSAVSSSLAGTIVGNPNYTASDSASLILNQITSNNPSYLGGILEVAGDSAGIIIANPNGIVCDTCSFANTDKVDLITGTANFDTAGVISDYTTAANDIFIYEANIVVNDFNAIVGDDFGNTGGNISADNFNVTAGNDFDNRDFATIHTNEFNVTAENWFSNSDSATINANSFNVVGSRFYNQYNSTINANDFNVTADVFYNQDSATIDADDFNVTTGTSFTNNNSTINANAFNVTAGSYFYNYISTINADDFNVTADVFYNQDSATIDADDFNVTTGTSFTNNNSTINANAFNVTAGSYFYNYISTINADDFNVTTGTSFTNNNSTINANAFNVTAGNDFTNQDTATIDANDFNVTAGNDFTNQDTATINADNFNVTTGEDFSNSARINADNFNVTTGEDFSNSARINADNFNVTAGDDFSNWFGATIDADNFNVTAGDDFYNRNSAIINADTVTIEVANFANNISNENAGTVSVDSLNFILTDDFTHASGSFTNFNNFSNLTVSTDGTFTNNSAIDLAGVNLTITANSFNNTSGTTINADTLTIEVPNFADDITNSGTVSSASLNFILTADFTHTSTSITGFSFNNLGVSTDGTFTNNATINPTGNLTITANSFDNTGGVLNAATFALSVAGDFDYANNGTITTTTAYNLNVGGDFSNNDSASNFTWRATDTLTVLGTASVVADSFNNSGTIAVSNSSFDITATDFTNSGTISANTTLNTTVSSTESGSFNNTGEVLNADTFALSVAGDFDYVADFNGTITTNSFNLNVGGDFSNNDSVNDFTWGANDSLTVLGNANITANNYIQSGAIDVVGDWSINTANNFIYNRPNNDFIWGANDSLTVLGTASVDADSFENSGTISANNFNATVNTFVNEASATITAGECNIVHTTSYIDNGTITCLDSATGDATVINIARTLSNGISNNSYATFHIPSNGVIFNNSVSDATSQLAGFISANPNYTNGNAATLILAQITGNNISILFGALEVFGAEAGVIIANPNGIICNACSFLNASRVDLVTGSYNIPAGIYDVNEAAGINLSNGLDASSVAVLNIQAGSFTNTGGLKANSFNLYVAGNFDYADRGNVTASSFNLDVDGNFSNNDSNNNFILDSLTVSGNADITTNNYIQSGAIDVAGALTINANSYTYNSPNSDFVLAENDSLSISSGDFTITANNYIQFGTLEILEVYGALVIDAKRNFSNSGSIITAGSLEITAGHTAINQGSIVSNSLDITTDDFFRNLTGGDISVDSLNITAGGKVTNTANITVGTLNIIANNNSSRTNDPAGTFFYVSNRGNITATDLNIAAVDNFYNRGNITADNFQITRAKSVFFLNEEIDSFVGTYDGGNISLSGDSSFTADGDDAVDGGIIVNRGNIDLGGFNLIIAADSFINHAGANVTADTLNLTVSSFINDGTIDATIDQ